MRKDQQDLIKCGEIPSGPAPVFTFNSLILSRIALLEMIIEFKSITLLKQLLITSDKKAD